MMHNTDVVKVLIYASLDVTPLSVLH